MRSCSKASRFIRAGRMPTACILIESGGDGAQAGFDAGLSRRRSEAISAFLLARGLAGDRIRIAVQEDYGVRPPEGTELDALLARIGHVQERVTGAEYRRLYPDDLTVECF